MHAVNVARRVCSNKRCTIMCFWFSICVSEGWSNSDCDMRAEKPHCRDCFPRPGTRRTTFWLHWASPENSGPLFAIVGMSPLPPLDEVLHAKILGYVTEPKACVSCQSWKQYLYDALKLEPRIRFMQRVKENGSVTFCYNAVRPLGEDFEESVGYTFNFFSDGIYRLAWTRTYDAWSSQGEQHYGKWAVDMDHVCCETLEPKVQAEETEMRYAPAGFKFAVPLEEILNAKGGYFQAKDGSRAAEWELPARTGKIDSGDSVWTAGMWAPLESEVSQVQAPQAPQVLSSMRADARYVDIDGEMHEVSGDIVANWPEDQWPRLMRCRLRFGIRG
ncbi:unnamed protein product [Effrenium voratum]|nr:unnamed protein product [Effrenium voratum]